MEQDVGERITKLEERIDRVEEKLRRLLEAYKITSPLGPKAKS